MKIKRTFKSMLPLCIIAALIFNTIPGSAAAEMPSISKAKVYIDYLVAKGIVAGNSDGTLKPEDKITNIELLETVLKAQNVMKGEPVQKLIDAATVMTMAAETGLVKSNEGLSKAHANPTIEQASMVLYRVMKDKEKFGDYFGQYDYPLDHTISDYNKISPYYKPGVAVCFAKGLMTWTEKTKKTDRWGVRYIYPKNAVTRAEMCSLVAKMVDENKRATVNTISGLRQTKYLTLLLPEESKTPKYLAFENGRPVVDREKDLVELWQTTKSTLTGSFKDSQRHDEIINSEWPLGQTLDYKTKIITNQYESAYKFIEKLFNVTYKDDLIQYEKDLRYYSPKANYVNNYVKRHMKMIKEQKLSFEGIVVTDPKMMYSASDNSKRTKMRLYFKISSPISKTVQMQKRMFMPAFYETTLKTNQWYLFDFEGSTSGGGEFGSFKETWPTDEFTYDETYNLSHFIPIYEKK